MKNVKMSKLLIGVAKTRGKFLSKLVNEKRKFVLSLKIHLLPMLKVTVTF